MSDLAFYRREYMLFKKAYFLKLNSFLIGKIFRKLVRHYKLDNVEIVFKKGKAGLGLCSYNRRAMLEHDVWANRITLKLNNNCSLNVLVHEVGHAIELRRYNETKHGKRLMRIISGVHKYISNNASIQEEVVKYNEGLNGENDFTLSNNLDEAICQIIGGN